MSIETTVIGQTPSGDEVTRFRLSNDRGHSISLMNWGATLLDVNVPDRQGNLANVNLCFDSLQPYFERHPYFGATVGRYCNRIGGARFTIDGTEYRLTENLGKHHIHGGQHNFTYQCWSAEVIDADQGDAVRFRLTSPAGQEGYPGNLNAWVDYVWNQADELTMVFAAQSDAPTHVSLCNHSYWNLSGAGSGSVMDHRVAIEADEYLDVDEGLIPTGKLNSVAGTPLDFRQATRLGDRIDQLPATKGYDHCYVIRGRRGALRPAARVEDPTSGRVMEVETTQPGMQLYTANHLSGDAHSNNFGPHEAFCLETQRFPDSPNRDSFPSTLLRPGETFRETTVHRFATA